MGVTTGELSDMEFQDITITIPGELSPAEAQEVSDKLNEIIAQINQELQREALTVESVTSGP